MKKTFNINLGGLAFIIDENAFELLHRYIETLKLKFNNEAERTEIINDIELRIAEMLSQKLADRKKEVVSVEDVQAVMDIMGKPEDIAGEETSTDDNNPSSATSSNASPTGEPVKRRLYRDPDDAKVSGVISGLCHYFGINDPVWVRIAAVILIFFTSGTIIFLYFLLAIIVPKASSATEKLQMKGEPVNIKTIEKEIKEGAGRAAESVHQFMKSRNIFERLWSIIAALFRTVGKTFSIFFIVLSMALLVVVVFCFLGFYVLGTTPYNDISHLLVNSPSIFTFFSIGLLLFLATPLIALIYAALRFLLGQRSRVRWLKGVLAALWLIGIIFLGISGLQVYDEFKADGAVNRDYTLIQPAGNTLYVQLADSSGKKADKSKLFYENVEEFHADEKGVFINGVNLKDMPKIVVGSPSLQLIASENDSFYIQQLATARGKHRGEAIRNAEMVIYSFNQTDTVLNLNPFTYIDQKSRWRAQHVKVRVAIPEGKKIRFGDNIDLWYAYVKGDSKYDDTYFANTTWTVEKGKVICVEGENHSDAQKEESWPQKHKHDKEKDY